MAEENAVSESLSVDRAGSPYDAEKLDPSLERKVLWRLDLLLVPVMCGLYLISFLDRSNIGNARVAGMQADLKITDTQYSTGEYMKSPSRLLSDKSWQMRQGTIDTGQLLTSYSHHSHICAIYRRGTPLQSPYAQDWTKATPSISLSLLGHCRQSPISSQLLLLASCLPFFSRHVRRWDSPWDYTLSVDILPPI